jgi:thioredoxin-like negative regulator of GroEL
MMIQLGMVAQELHRSVGVYKINYDSNEKLAEKYVDEAIPFTIIVRKGKVLDSVEGYEEAENLLEKIEKVS